MLRSLLTTSALIAATTTAATAGGLADPVMAPAPAPIAVAPAPMMASADWTGFYIGGSVGTSDVNVADGDDIDASNYGIQAGYLYDLGAVVLGGEIDYDKLDVDGLGDASVLRLKGKVGYDAGAFMPYVTAGGAQLTLKDLGDIDDTGYFFGVGADYAVTDNVRVGAEVLQHKFEDFNTVNADVEATTMALKVSYSF